MGPQWLENIMYSNNLWAFDAVFPNATVKFDGAGDVLQRGVAPERFTAAELMWRNFVDIGFFEQMKQYQNTTSMLCDIGAADGAVTAYVVEAFKLLQEAKRVTRPGGFVLVADDMATTDDMARAQRNAQHDPHGIFRSEEEWRAL